MEHLTELKKKKKKNKEKKKRETEIVPQVPTIYCITETKTTNKKA